MILDLQRLQSVTRFHQPQAGATDQHASLGGGLSVPSPCGRALFRDSFIATSYFRTLFLCLPAGSMQLSGCASDIFGDSLITAEI